MILANLISLVPTDTSALESAISALETSISALESSIASVESSLPFWEYLGFGCALLVAIGVLLELQDVSRRFSEDRAVWALSYFGVSRSLDRPQFFNKYWVELASIILVAGGITGELSAGLMIESKNAALRAIDIQLRSKNSELRSKSDQLIALVSKQADDARLETALIEEGLAWRTLSPHDEGLLHRRLWHITKQTFALSYNMGDAEAASFAWSIARTIDGADLQVNAPNNIEGWVRQGVPTRSALGQQYAKAVSTMFGVVVSNSGKSAEDWKAGKSLVSVLTKCGFDATFSIGPPKNPSSFVVIFIATRPRGPQGEAKLKLEAIKNKQMQSEH